MVCIDWSLGINPWKDIWNILFVDIWRDPKMYTYGPVSERTARVNQLLPVKQTN